MPKLVELQKPYRPLLPPCANQFLGEIVGQGSCVLEFGAGASTVWLAQQGCGVISIEHSKEWAQYIKQLTQDYSNVKLRQVGKTNFPYSAVQYDDESFDLVFVDCWSRVRNTCVGSAMPKIKPGGYLLLDDTQWEILQPSIKLLSAWDSKDFYGIVSREKERITKRNVEQLRAQAKVEITRCTFWQKP